MSPRENEKHPEEMRHLLGSSMRATLCLVLQIAHVLDFLQVTRDEDYRRMRERFGGNIIELRFLNAQPGVGH